tara:strand:- start:352 stop:1050 length:699 start_codon:yes stop_codon:yes gene_type:complete
MDEFLSGLANYTEKGNPYHSIDAYPGTEFEQTENILKLFYPLIAFQFENGLRIILTNGLIKEVFRKLDFRYYLNYMILPKIEKYRNSLPKLSDMENDFNTVVGFSKGYSKENNYKEEFMNVYFPGVDYEEDYQTYTQMLNQIPKPIPGITEFQKRVNLPRVISESGDYPERDNRIDYLRYKVNNHKNNLVSIKKVIELLIHFDTHFDTFLQKIENYLRVIQFAGIHELVEYL